MRVQTDAVRRRLFELLAQSRGSIRLLAEELENGGDPSDIAARMHAGADYIGDRLTDLSLDASPSSSSVSSEDTGGAER